MSKFAVIIAAAGKGERFGVDQANGSQSKIFAKLDGRPVFIRTLELFINREEVAQTLLVVSADQLDSVKKDYGPNLGFMGVQLVEGGAERHESVMRGIEQVREDIGWVAIHDAARPCVSADMIDAVFAEAQKSGAAILASPLHGTIKRVSQAGIIDATISRERLYEAQTPQVFSVDVIKKAHAAKPTNVSNNDLEITDDAQLVELIGHPVSVVESDLTNLKITTKPDMALAHAIIKSRPAKVVKRMGAFDEAQW